MANPNPNPLRILMNGSPMADGESQGLSPPPGQRVNLADYNSRRMAAGRSPIQSQMQPGDERPSPMEEEGNEVPLQLWQQAHAVAAAAVNHAFARHSQEQQQHRSLREAMLSDKWTTAQSVWSNLLGEAKSQELVYEMAQCGNTLRFDRILAICEKQDSKVLAAWKGLGMHRKEWIVAQDVLGSVKEEESKVVAFDWLHRKYNECLHNLTPQQVYDVQAWCRTFERTQPYRAIINTLLNYNPVVAWPSVEAIEWLKLMCGMRTPQMRLKMLEMIVSRGCCQAPLDEPPVAIEQALCDFLCTTFPLEDVRLRALFTVLDNWGTFPPGLLSNLFSGANLVLAHERVRARNIYVDNLKHRKTLAKPVAPKIVAEDQPGEPVCIACQTNIRRVYQRPCGHTILCKACYLRLGGDGSQCCTCKQVVEEGLPLFL
jgi:hypothetical protein